MIFKFNWVMSIPFTLMTKIYETHVNSYFLSSYSKFPKNEACGPCEYKLWAL